jgi:hypothetical protein
MIPIPLVIVGVSGSLFRAFHTMRRVPNHAIVSTASKQPWISVTSGILTFLSDVVRDVVGPLVAVILAIRAVLALYQWLEERRRNQDNLLAQLRNVDIMMFQYDSHSRRVTVGTIQRNPFTLRVVQVPTDQVIYPSKLLAKSFS